VVGPDNSYGIILAKIFASVPYAQSALTTSFDLGPKKLFQIALSTTFNFFTFFIGFNLLLLNTVMKYRVGFALIACSEHAATNFLLYSVRTAKFF
jgi:hypothetical protein